MVCFSEATFGGCLVDIAGVRWKLRKARGRLMRDASHIHKLLIEGAGSDS